MPLGSAARATRRPNHPPAQLRVVAQSWQRPPSPGAGAIRPPHSGQATGASADTAAHAPLISWSSVERPPTATGRQAG